MHGGIWHWRAIGVCASLTFLAAVVNGDFQLPVTESPESQWTGRWMPHPPYSEHVDIHDREHVVRMGVVTTECDDAKTNLTLDWDYSPADYTCYTYNRKYLPDRRIKPILECENIPMYYSARHECMNKSIHYESAIPTYGTHRPLWPQYGEYKFVPRQRWVHNLEHGAVVMLYHPCANKLEVNRLRYLVKNCLRRHVITPLALLDEERPLALVTWGCRLTMSTVQAGIVKNFIKQHALRGPEKLSRDGQYNLDLEVPAVILTDVEDSVLCPRH
ncbi:uncharacterized protein LOC110833602 isoform X1 [Zootermopsis nevadensis]|uniref:Tumor protein p53-inducible protein 13 n=1 Tax=Zootermopsis nevadensis TaxID=136037 RepID=A0A067R7G5_ZOONE|nr:uncharacterized protein LOC110833602 isoform X1 [Zootermopsis nevadensis]KDR15445.1 hypothetical protein L798_09150 [Zootermopsis nevadensis]